MGCVTCSLKVALSLEMTKTSSNSLWAIIRSVLGPLPALITLLLGSFGTMQDIELQDAVQMQLCHTCLFQPVSHVVCCLPNQVIALLPILRCSSTIDAMLPGACASQPSRTHFSYAMIAGHSCI